MHVKEQLRNRSQRVSLSAFTAFAFLISSPVPQTAGDVITEQVTFANGEVTLSGILTLPSGNGPHSAIVLISGSGPQNRDGESKALPGYRPFAIIAEHLTQNGFAVLRYDDRGVGRSSGDYLAADESDFIQDAQAAVEYLLARKDIASDQVGVLGLSEGSMIAAHIAGHNPRVAFVISVAGGAVDGYGLLIRQAERQAQAEGRNKEEVAQIVQDQRRIFDLVLAQKWEELQKVVGEVTLKRLRALPKEKAAAIGDLEVVARQRAVQSMRVFQMSRYQFLLAHDFGKDWEKVSVPVLALFGELDVQVDAAQNKTVLQQALQRGKNDNVTIRVIPGANHLFLKAKTGSMSEYSTLSKEFKEFAPGFLDAISDWLRPKSKSPGKRLPPRRRA
jgi:pimeloyl-ACP methyl ester carboxylesterase